MKQQLLTSRINILQIPQNSQKRNQRKENIWWKYLTPATIEIRIRNA